MNENEKDNPTQIKFDNGTVAKLAGRYKFEDDDGNDQYLKIYTVEKDVALKPKDRETYVLTPTLHWTHQLGDKQWQALHKEGSKSIVLHIDPWEIGPIKEANEIEVFDYAQNAYVSKSGDIFKIIKTTKDNSSKTNSFDEISEKLKEEKKYMSNTNSTLDMIKVAGIDAAKTVGAAQVNGMVTSAIIKGAESLGLPSEFLESENGKRVLALLGPLAIHYAADTQAEYIDNLIGDNASENIKEGCKFATQAALQDVMEPLLEFLVPLLKEIASAGAATVGNVAKGIGTPAATSSPATDKVQELLNKKTKVAAK